MKLKTKKLVIRRANLNLYKSQIILLIGPFEFVDEWAKEAMIKEKYDYIKDDLKRDVEKQLHGSTWNLGGGGSLIWLYKEKKDILVHEIVHAAMNLFEEKRTPINEDTHEPFAYLVEYLFRELSRKD